MGFVEDGVAGYGDRLEMKMGSSGDARMGCNLRFKGKKIELGFI